jgi:hypothetical protein
MEKFGQTLLFALFVLFIMIGAKMAFRVLDPYTRKVSPSLADALATV